MSRKMLYLVFLFCGFSYTFYDIFVICYSICKVFFQDINDIDSF